MGLYHLVLFAIKIDRSPLFFSLFCFILTVRLFVTGDMPITSYFNPNWFVLIRVEYLSFYLGGIMFMAFFASLFSSEMNKRIEKGVYFFIGFMSLIVLFAPPIVSTSLLIPGQVIILLMILYFFHVLYKANKHGNKEAMIFFVGFFFFNATLINDILFANEIIETGHLFSIGLFIFLGFQSALLSRRYVLAFKRNEDLLEQLNISNRELEEKVKERTHRLEDQKANLETSNLQITTQNNELRKLNSELDNFVYSVSHDLKAPIASMLGLINLSKNEGEIKTLKYYQEMMEQSLNRQNEFIGDILDYSRNARLSLRHDKINFKELITKTLELYQFIENWKKIKKDLDIVQEVAFITDRQRLNIVLSNVISNALKYSTVSNKSPEIQIKVKANEHEANIVIEDNGCGIDPSRMKNIFEMFYRADEKRSGSGLGLYIVKETLDKLNGKIDIQSTVGKGTTVHISLPGLSNNQD